MEVVQICKTDIFHQRHWCLEVSPNKVVNQDTRQYVIYLGVLYVQCELSHNVLLYSKFWEHLTINSTGVDL